MRIALLERPRALAYAQRVLNTERSNLIAYWPLWDPSGSALAEEQTGNVGSGVYSNVSLGQPGIGDGRSAALFNGSISYCNIYSTSLRSLFDPTVGSMMLWGRVPNVADWTENAVRRCIIIRADSNNDFRLGQSDSNTLTISVVFGGVQKAVSKITSTTDWFNAIVTWSTSLDQLKLYFNGAQVGSTVTGLGTWSGLIASDGAIVGADNLVPTSVWKGLIAHVAIWTKVLTPQQIARLSRVK